MDIETPLVIKKIFSIGSISLGLELEFDAGKLEKDSSSSLVSWLFS